MLPAVAVSSLSIWLNESPTDNDTNMPSPGPGQPQRHDEQNSDPHCTLLQRRQNLSFSDE